MTTQLGSFATLQCELEGEQPYLADLIKEQLAYAQELRRIGNPHQAAVIEAEAIKDMRNLMSHNVIDI